MPETNRTTTNLSPTRMRMRRHHLSPSNTSRSHSHSLLNVVRSFFYSFLYKYYDLNNLPALHHVVEVALFIFVTLLAYRPVTRDVIQATDEPTRAWEYLLLWDDQTNFVNRADTLPRWTTHSILKAFTEENINVYEPVSILFKKLVASTFGMQPLVWRGAALTLHCVHSCLVWRLLRSWIWRTRDPFGKTCPKSIELGAALAAIVYAVHPCHAEVVGWPSALPYTICAPLWVLSFLAHQEANRALSYRAGCALRNVLYAAAFLSKSVAVTLPLVHILWALFWHGEDVHNDTSRSHGICICWGVLGTLKGAAHAVARNMNEFGSRQMWCLFAVAVAVTMLANSDGTSESLDTIHLHYGERLAKACVTLVFYLRAFLWPVGLRVHYAVNVGADFEPKDVPGETLLSICATLALITWCGWALLAAGGRRARFGAVCLLAYVLLHLPTCGIVQHGIVQRGGDRYAYLPYVPLAALLASILTDAMEHVAAGSGTVEHYEIGTNKKKKAQPNGVAAGVIVVVPVLVFAAALGHLTSAQVMTWRSSEALYVHNLSVDPHDWRILQQYGDWLASHDRHDEAEDTRRVLVSILPPLHLPPFAVSGDATAPATSPKVVALLGKLALEQGKPPRSPQQRARNIADACAMYEAALVHHPDDAVLLNNVGVCRLQDEAPSSRVASAALFRRGLEVVKVPRDRRVLESNAAETKENNKPPFKCKLIF